MAEIIISAEDLGKRYKLRHLARKPSTSLREAISYRANRLWSAMTANQGGKQAAAETAEDFWALQGLNFSIERGDAVGIIGRNGAGKSTLLKILSRITEPSEGLIRLRGRVASLLEVGTGFHGELTGRENIFLNGAILGMTKAEISSRFDEIVAFSEVEKFLDTPVKHYSSGMYVRLAFAVAAHLEPEILIVDEVLAVGDADFQKKCLGKMKDFATAGRTVLFVSHNIQAVSTLTNKALMLDKGKLLAAGDAATVIAAYLAQATAQPDLYEAPKNPHSPNITRAEVLTSEPNKIHSYGKPLKILVETNLPFPLRNGNLSIQILDAMEQPITHVWTTENEKHFFRQTGNQQITCTLPAPRLYMGDYSVAIHFADYGVTRYEHLHGLCRFSVVMHGKHREYPWHPDECKYLEDADWQKK